MNGQGAPEVEQGAIVRAQSASVMVREPYRSSPNAYGVAATQQEDLWHYVLDIWRMIYKRKALIASIALAFVFIGAVRTFLQTPLYSATVRLQIDRSMPKIVEGGNVTPEIGMDLEFMRTQFELLQSRSMASRVAAATRVAEDPNFLEPRDTPIFAIVRRLVGIGTATGNQSATSPAVLEARATAIVQRSITVKPVPGSRLVDITVQDSSPVRAQRIANSYGDEFIASALDKRFQANSYAKTFLEDQTNQLKVKLEDAEKAVLDFAEREQIIVVSERASIAESNLAAANQALGNLITERIRHEQSWKQAESASGVNIPQILSNPSIEGLRQRRNLLVTEYQEKLETFKPGYPGMVQISNKLKEIDRQLAFEVDSIKKSLKAAFEGAANQENEMKGRIEELRSEVLDLQKRSIQYNILKREVDSTRQIYNSLLQRYKEVDVAGGVGANNIFVVDRAMLPGGPSSPILSRALLLAFGLGLGAGMLTAYVLERLDDTIRSPEELETITGVATLGIIPKVESEKMEEELGDPRSALSESYRSLCTGLQFSTDSGLPKTLLITSAGPAEGKSSTAVSIARHFSSMGLKVLLIDADLRNPSLHKKLGLDNGIGLSNYLTGACSPPDAFQRTSEPNLAFMASGPLPPNAADILGSPKLGSLLNVGLEVFDFIVIDGPPVMGLADAPILSNATRRRYSWSVPRRPAQGTSGLH